MTWTTATCSPGSQPWQGSSICCAATCRHTELGQRSYTLINTKNIQKLASLLRPSYVVVLAKQDKQLGVPHLEPVHHGLDFGRVFADPLAGGPCRQAAAAGGTCWQPAGSNTANESVTP
jgi:hypothetical protein